MIVQKSISSVRWKYKCWGPPTQNSSFKNYLHVINSGVQTTEPISIKCLFWVSFTARAMILKIFENQLIFRCEIPKTMFFKKNAKMVLVKLFSTIWYTTHAFYMCLYTNTFIHKHLAPASNPQLYFVRIRTKQLFLTNLYICTKNILKRVVLSFGGSGFEF